MKALALMGSILAAGLIMAGCADKDDNREYKVTVTNLTNAQPLSPVAVILHGKGYTMYEIGAPASVALERLAEGGDNTLLIAEAEADTHVKEAKGGAGAIVPGGAESVRVSGDGAECIGVATMLVNTNDAFAGSNCIDISKLHEGEAMHLNVGAYDAGTEGNSESAATIPGPAGGGEGFNAARDDRDFVAAHGGVVTSDDGLAASALTYDHRWDNPVMRIDIVRID
jgi:hypothetical protein